MQSAALSILLLALPAVLLVAQRADPEPSPKLGPEAVVRIQVEAFQTGADGIATAFRFASPSNRAATGPLPRFEAMIRGGYADLLTAERAEYGDLRVRGEEAAQRVTLIQPDGARSAYVFGLSRQRGGACNGCWMTDAVMPIEPPAPRTFRI